MAVLIALLALKHSASLPQPDDQARLTHALLKLRRNSTQDFLVHVIYSECSCSRALLAHLLKRRPFPNSEELILFVGPSGERKESAWRSGFEFNDVSAPDIVSGFGLEAAPVLVIFDTAGKLHYAGGYYDHPATIRPLDETIYEQFKRGSPLEPLPVFGCAISSRLQKTVNPLHL